MWGKKLKTKEFNFEKMNNPDLSNNKKKDEDLFFKEFFGARKQTILKLKGLYEEEYFGDKELQKKREKMYLQEFARLKKYFNINKGGNVLDIGCGTGDFLSLFGERWNKYGIEISDIAREAARKKGVIADFELKDGFFDLIIFRGTIQHIPDPIYRIGECYYWLKDGGGLVFLSTPNINSIYYKLFNTLPMLNERYNFFLPSDKTLKQILNNFGFSVKGIEYPYRNTPYASPIKDVFSFLLKFFKIRKNIKFPFYKNLMECYAEKIIK